MTQLQARILISILYFPALLCSVWDGRIFGGAVLLMLGASWYEFLSFKWKPTSTSELWKFWGLVALMSSPALFALTGRPGGFALSFALMAAALLIYVIRSMMQHKGLPEIMSSLQHLALGFFYLTISYSLLLFIRDSVSGKQAVWFIIFIVSVSDSVAYLVGRQFGRKPFFQHLSPKKTVEGFWGGMLGAAATAIAFYFIFRSPADPLPSLALLILLGLVAGFAGVFGDLFESMLKRHFGVKDSSHLMGAHGGVMDRFDALLFATVPIFFYIMVRNGFF